MSKALVVVESPAKARTLGKYLGRDYQVLASYGHVRDLEAKSGSVEPKAGFRMNYQPIKRNVQHVELIRKALRGAKALYLATDPDREGEAIAWHLCQLLRDKGALRGKEVRRVVFHEVTRAAVQEALKNPRDLESKLVDAQQARRALDYLVGFNLSPLLWKKIRGGLSAGRVQSPALRMITEREEEIERFKKREYWTLEAQAAKREKPQARFHCQLVEYEGKKLGRFDVGGEQQATSVREKLRQAARGVLHVRKVEKKQRRRHPAAPFTTSTLQQEAARKLGFNAQRTMQVAQQLYEGVELPGGSSGLITYMRTDSNHLAAEALAELRAVIAERYGKQELPARANVYKTKAKNAQEAHEAVRPTEPRLLPEQVRASLTSEQYRLYDLVWKRSVACQMRSALFDQVTAQLDCGGQGVFRAHGSTLAEPGFIQVYQEGMDVAEQQDPTLPPLRAGEEVDLLELKAEQHFTEPPPRYTEASLVRTLEEHGIGRPSTYAAILSTLRRREYVEMNRKQFVPTDIGRIVSRFLTTHFPRYVDYKFTARLEDELDAISRGERDWVPVLENFWEDFDKRVREKDRGVTRSEAVEERCLGSDPKSGLKVYARVGRYGPFVRLEAASKEEKPKFSSLLSGQRVETVTLQEALKLLSLPRPLGESPEGEAVEAGLGRYGPYVKSGKVYASLEEGDDPHTVELGRALELLKARRIGRRPIQEFEKEGIRVMEGRYGPYVTDGEVNASVPKSEDPATLDVARARELLEARRKVKKGKGRAKKQAVGKKVIRKQTARKKVTRKKAARKKVTRKKAAVRTTRGAVRRAV